MGIIEFGEGFKLAAPSEKDGAVTPSTLTLERW